VDSLDHDNAEEHPSSQDTPLSQPDIPPTTVKAARDGASAAVFNMKTLGSHIQGVVSAVDSANDPVSLFLDTLSKFNNIVNGLAKVNATHPL
jgi:hypothetical protein